jgi:hypothetical protein
MLYFGSGSKKGRRRIKKQEKKEKKENEESCKDAARTSNKYVRQMSGG